jgi:hypothetical protein
VHKTVFTTIYGTFVSNVMQQGDCNAPSTFQREMYDIFREYISIFMHIYLNNILVFSKLVQEHQEHLKKVFACLCEHEFYLHQDKCELFTDKVECLGHLIDEKPSMQMLIRWQRSVTGTKHRIIMMCKGS